MLTRRALLLSAAAPAPARFFHKGVNFTAERPDVYDSPKAHELLRSLPRYGVNTVALVPYGFTRRGSAQVQFGGSRMWERDDAILAMAASAQKAGMRVLLKPQVWVGGGYPGDLDFSTDADRAQWFSGYHSFVEHYAQLATQARADLFCIGVEFAKLVRHDHQWRSLIARARKFYAGPLTYAATQGPEFETLNFWDALDYIGLNNYYPFPDSLDTTEMVAKVETVQKRYGKPILFPEAGYSSVENPNRDPWAERHRPLSLDDQARCYDALCRAFFPKKWFAGVYWWKVGSNGFGGPADATHTPWNKPAMEVVRRWFIKHKIGVNA